MEHCVIIEAKNCPCCGTFFPRREFYLPFEVLVQILDNDVLGKSPLLLSKRFGQTLYPKLYHRLVPFYQPVTETYFVSDLTGYNGSFPSAKQWVVNANTIKFSFYYQFDPHDSELDCKQSSPRAISDCNSDTCELNKERGNPTKYVSKLQPLYCPIEKIRILKKRIDLFNELFSCTIPKDKVLQTCTKELLVQLEERDVTKILCYILMVADALKICPLLYYRDCKDRDLFYVGIRDKLLPSVITEIKRRFNV